MEIIVDVIGFPDYQVSNLGYVISKQKTVKSRYGNRTRKSKKLRLNYNQSGYVTVSMYLEGKLYLKLLHRVLAEAFIPNPENKPFINHIDHNRSNNNLNNLEWCTQKENIQSFIKHAKKNNKTFGENFGIRVFNVVSGVEYSSIKEASIKEKIYLKDLQLKLKGQKINDTNLVYSKNQNNVKGNKKLNINS